MNLLTECSCWGRAGAGGCWEDLSLHQRKRVCTQGRHCEHAEWGGGGGFLRQITVIRFGSFPRSVTDRYAGENGLWGLTKTEMHCLERLHVPAFHYVFTIASRAFWSCPAPSHFKWTQQQTSHKTAPVLQTRGWKWKLLFSVILTAVDRLFKTNTKLLWLIDTHGKYSV